MTDLDARQETEQARDVLALAFPDRPVLVSQERSWREEKSRVIKDIQAALSKPRSSRRASLGFHWGETAVVILASLGLALVIGRIVPGPVRNLPGQALRVIDTKGQVLCERNDGKHWTACDPLSNGDFVGLRTLDRASVAVESVSGVRLRLDAFTTLSIGDSLESAASRVTLSEGNLDVNVPTLAPNHRFSVLTPNATLSVQGSSFTVEVKKSANQPHQTCVRLREGTISIHTVGRDQDLVAPGSWGCGPRVRPDSEKEPAIADNSSSAQMPSGRVRALTKRRIAAVPPSRAAQYWSNRLLFRAQAAEQRKDWVTVEKNLRNLLMLYPASAAAPQAKTMLERLENQKAEAKRLEAEKAEARRLEAQKAEQKPEPLAAELTGISPPTTTSAPPASAVPERLGAELLGADPHKSDAPKPSGH